MNIAKIEWVPFFYDPNTLHGKINGIIFFELRTTGVSVYTTKLLSYPFDNHLFTKANNSKILATLKADNFPEREKNIEYLKQEAEDMILFFLEMFIEKPQLYKVKLNDKTSSEKYLSYENGVVATYTRGEAIKKARVFNGKIEKA